MGDIGSSEQTDGQTFTALSRLQTMEGLLLEDVDLDRLLRIGLSNSFQLRLDAIDHIRQLENWTRERRGLPILERTPRVQRERSSSARGRGRGGGAHGRGAGGRGAGGGGGGARGRGGKQEEVEAFLRGGEGEEDRPPEVLLSRRPALGRSTCAPPSTAAPRIRGSSAPSCSTPSGAPDTSTSNSR